MIITNENESHKELLIGLFDQSDEIVIASGFLKNSGVNNIKESLKRFCTDKSKKSTFYIGIGFGETDPNALESLNTIIKSKRNHQLVLCTPGSGIFHSKIYVFRKEQKVTIIVGSANLTEAGWCTNDEVSIITETSIDSLEYKQLENYFNRLHKAYFTENISELILNYKEELDDFKKKFAKIPSFRFQREESVIEGIDMPLLKGYYRKYLISKEFVDPEKREKQYKKAKENLEILASDIILDNSQFQGLFSPLVGHAGFEKLWHSGSIHRGTHVTLNKYSSNFRFLISEIRKYIDQPIDLAFKNSISLLNKMRRDNEISGIGENIITEILMTFSYKKFANLNRNPLTVLSLIGKKYKNPNAFNGADYVSYTLLLSKIIQELDMNSFLEIDSFFNYVYWNLKEE